MSGIRLELYILSTSQLRDKIGARSMKDPNFNLFTFEIAHHLTKFLTKR